MSAVSDWIVQIGLLVLIAGVIELILPDTSVRGTVRLVVGLIVILAIVEPVVRWVNDPFVVDRLAQTVFVEDGRRFVEAGSRLADESAQDAARVWKRNMELQLEGMIGQVGNVRDVGVIVQVGAGGEIRGIDVTLRPEPEEEVQVVETVRRLIQGVVPLLEPSAIVITQR